MKIRSIATAVAMALTLIPANAAISKQSTAAAAATPKRYIAMEFARDQIGDPYSQRNPQGPNHWDCSGLVQAAYKKAGYKDFPRTTYTIIKYKKLKRTYSPHWGDIVFLSAGHVELYGHGGSKGWMLGAHHSGTRVSYVRIYKSGSGWPKFYHVSGAG
jgi:cell wall-associated NlpC family hydrolase